MKCVGLLLITLSAAAAQPDAARKLTNQGLAAYDRGDYPESERLNLEAVAKWQALGADFTPHLAITRMNLGNALSGQGKRGQALGQFEEALALFRRSLGVRHLYTLTCMNLLAALDVMLNDYTHAGLLWEEALPIERELYPSDIQLARTLSGLGYLRLREGRPAEALPLAEEGLTLAIQAAGEDSLDAAIAFGNVAEVHRISGRPDRALPLYRRARYIYEKQLGPQHPRVAGIMAQEALLLIGDNKVALAEADLKRALAILDRSCPNCAFERWTAECNLALAYMRQDKYPAADRLLSDALMLEEKTEPRPSSDMAATLKTLALVRQKQRRFQDADRLNRRAAALSFASAGPT